MENYQVDESQKHVKIQVQAGVLGIPLTSVYILKDNVFTFLFDSEGNDKGDIELKKVGTNKGLSGDVIRVITVMRLSNLKPEQRKHAIDNIFILYTLTGGPETSHYQVIDDEVDTEDEKRVVISKFIKCI